MLHQYSSILIKIEAMRHQYFIRMRSTSRSTRDLLCSSVGAEGEDTSPSSLDRLAASLTAISAYMRDRRTVASACAREAASSA